MVRMRLIVFGFVPSLCETKVGKLANFSEPCALHVHSDYCV